MVTNIKYTCAHARTRVLHSVSTVEYYLAAAVGWTEAQSVKEVNWYF